MARTPLKNQPWRATRAAISGIPPEIPPVETVVARLSAEGIDLKNARIVWEASGKQPEIGETFHLSPGPGKNWVEVEAQLPDGRRVFARQEFEMK